MRFNKRPRKLSTWELKGERLAYNGYRKIIRRTYQTHTGIAESDILMEHDSCCIPAVTTDGNIILAKQFRPSPGQILCELPGGAVEGDEDPIHAATRELAEETGHSGRLSIVAKTPIDAYSSALRYHFIAEDCEPTTSIANDDHEHTELVLMSMADFPVHLAQG